MNNINQYHDFFKSQQSDINEHLETLKQYAHDHIVTEFGVRHAVSTFSILSGMPIRLISWDIKYYSQIDTIIELCKKENKQFKFELGDTKLCNIEQTDILFIDTLHTYEQLITELNRHHTKVNNNIILHDTTSYEFTDEILHGYVPAKNKKTGLWTAVQEFLENNPEWNIKHRFINNNGLTILEKIS